MSSERVTAYTGDDGDQRDGCWLELDGKYLWGGFGRESLAQKLADRLNAAFKKTEADANDERIMFCKIAEIAELYVRIAMVACEAREPETRQVIYAQRAMLDRAHEMLSKKIEDGDGDDG